MIVTGAFLVSALVVIVAPGPDLMLITNLVIAARRRAPAVAAAFGMITAGAVQVALGAAGLAALLLADPALFTAVRWTGAAVLLGWAVLALRAALGPAPADKRPPHPAPRRAFAQGFLCTGSNPKVGVFLMAFLPQFVPPGVDPVGGVAVLAAVHLGMGLGWLLVWTQLVHRLGRFVHSPVASRIAAAVTAAVFGAFAVRLVLAGA